MTGGWKGQLQRVRRWHARMNAAVESDDRTDFLFAFFEAALHLRDWLLDTAAVPPKTLEAFFASHVEMRVCRDLANAWKHYSISRPSQNAPPSVLLEYTQVTGAPARVTLVVLSDGQKYDAFELATECLVLWEEFLLASDPSAGNRAQSMPPVI